MESTKKIAKSTLIIVLFSLVGKVLGFTREILMANKFGATLEMDAFNISQNTIAMISTLITAAIATTFIPTIQKVERELGKNKKLYFTNNMLFIVSAVSLIIIILGIVFAPAITFVLTLDVNYKGYELMTKLMRIGMVTILFSTIAGVFTGYLHNEGKFGAVGAMAIPLNLTFILYLGYLSPHAGIVGLTIASVVGVLLQLLILIPSAAKSGYRLKFIFDVKDRYVKEALLLAVPVLVSSAVSDVNSTINNILALKINEGAVSILGYANKINMMVMGVFITAITAIIFPVMSRYFGSKNMVQGKSVMSASIKAVLFITVPATVGMLIFARPIVEIAFLHGKFTTQNVIDTASTLRFYSFALISLSFSSVLNRVFYSLSDTKTPFIVGVVNVLLNIGINLIVAQKFGTRGMAASVSISTAIAVFLDFVFLRRKIGRLGMKSYIKAFIKVAIASVVMGLFCLVYFQIESTFIPTLVSGMHLKIIKLAVLFIVIIVAVIIYSVCLYFLGVREVRDIVKIISRKLKRDNYIK
ncbi:putative peptidoglycan lipid II flippase [Anaerosphaera aminiphila DSM 21120]|uniref:Probable lipid II flippase MurJ n=1 Tax=Anaerosphaera aminiphila DSM 21120 TaxID=1120995 RepID=A0A1M5TSG7_9FIRM|nr:murein biosynthesis integral membrane protein MurJ [Anaerosphaera aminiphila]SHH53343.1 putative peptidoglycan lipid II flippase [Anaerosphaera aminiphila DSM 21120]